MMCSFFDECFPGVALHIGGPFVLLVPPWGGVAPARGSIPSGGGCCSCSRGPHPNFSLACEACRPGGGARGLTMASQLPVHGRGTTRSGSLWPLRGSILFRRPHGIGGVTPGCSSWIRQERAQCRCHRSGAHGFEEVEGRACLGCGRVRATEAKVAGGVFVST